MGTEREYPEGSDHRLYRAECPECGKGNLSVYADGHAFCFSHGCGYRVSASSSSAPTPPAPTRRRTMSPGLIPPTQADIDRSALSSRKLTDKTLSKYGVFRAGYNGTTVQVYPYYNMDGNLCAQKLRLPGKDFTVLAGDDYPGKTTKLQLFGRHVFGDRFDRQVIITEGELDALSVAQALDFKVAVVSVASGSDGAVKDLKANYLWLDRFADIVLWLDDDEKGRAATEECAALFKVGKVRVAKVEGYKDPSEVLVANRPGDISTAIYAASSWKPRGIINPADTASDVLAPRDKASTFEYPTSMARLQGMTGGIHRGEVTYHVAGTGVGKSTQLREILHDLAHRQGCKVGALFFEDTRRDAQMLLMAITAGERLQLVPEPDPESPTFEEDAAAYDKKMLKWHAATFECRLFELFDAQTAEWTFDAVLGYIFYMAKALDCEVILVDPLSFIVALLGDKVDERRALDMVAAKMAQAAKELNIAIKISHHLKRTMGIPHEEGAPTSLNELRSSGGMANFASCVIGWERNSQADGDGWRVTRSRVLKPHRKVGLSGLADVLYYGEDGRLTVSNIPFPPPGKPDGDADAEGQPRSGGFSAAGADY